MSNMPGASEASPLLWSWPIHSFGLLGRKHTIFIGIALVISAVLSACGASSPPHGPLAEDFESQWQASEGQWRIVNYWAIWCTPCREEIPELNALNQEDDVVVFGVNYDGKTGAELDEHSRELSIKFDQLAQDPASFLGTTRPQVLPTTLIVDPKGGVVATLVGPQTQANILAAIDSAGKKNAG